MSKCVLLVYINLAINIFTVEALLWTYLFKLVCIRCKHGKSDTAFR